MSLSTSTRVVAIAMTVAAALSTTSCAIEGAEVHDSNPAASSAAVATPTPNSPASMAATVKWGDGKNPPGMKIGIPNPPGWYEAAFGARTTEKVLYLTYDDGPYPATTDRILKILADNDAKATFFILGRQVDAFPGYVKKITAAGHALGNHTQNHDNLALDKPAKIRKQLTDVEQRVGPTLGKCMRPPGGFIDDQAGAVITGMGLVPILWTGHAQDWAPPATARMIEMLKEATAPGAVILLHDSADKERTIAASEVMIPWWKKHGYRLETIPACRT